MTFRGQVSGSEELVKKFEGLDEAIKGDVLEAAVLAGGLVLLNAARGNVKEQGLIRTRTLSRSLHEEVTEKTPTRVTVEAGTNLEYAAIHEYGGVIKPKNSQYLAIPIGSLTGSPRKHAGLRLRKTPAGNLLLVDESGTPQYILKTSVEIPARPYMRPAWDSNQDEIKGQIASTAQKQILKAAS